MSVEMQVRDGARLEFRTCGAEGLSSPIAVVRTGVGTVVLVRTDLARGDVLADAALLLGSAELRGLRLWLGGER